MIVNNKNVYSAAYRYNIFSLHMWKVELYIYLFYTYHMYEGTNNKSKTTCCDRVKLKVKINTGTTCAPHCLLNSGDGLNSCTYIFFIILNWTAQCMFFAPVFFYLLGNISRRARIRIDYMARDSSARGHFVCCWAVCGVKNMSWACEKKLFGAYNIH